MSDARDPCRVLPWDTAFFGRKIALVQDDRLTPESLRQIEAFSAREKIECLYFRARPDESQTVRLAEDNGFHLVDVRTTWERDLTGDETGRSRRATESDLPALQRIARVSHTDTRFYFDPHFGREKCDELYETWIANSLKDSTVLVAEEGGEIAGYVTCDRVGAEGVIGLIAVAGGHRCKGFGRELVNSAVQHFRQLGASNTSVVTQARNVAAQRLYGRCGFVVRGVQLYYHRWT